MLNKYGYEKIISEEMYKKEFKEWNKKLKSIGMKDLAKDPLEYRNKIKAILIEGAQRELLAFSDVKLKIARMNKELGLAQRFKGSMSEKKKLIKQKAKEYFKK